MDELYKYIFLLIIIAIIGILSKGFPIILFPLLILSGMAISFVPHFSKIELQPDLILKVFLPLLIYESCVIFPLTEVFNNLRHIILLSVGHVFFITLLVAIVSHYFIPSLSWPFAFVLGAIVSPPDHVAVTTIAKSNYLPQRLTSILQGEGMLNDAAALVIFKFALTAALTNQFIMSKAVLTFIAILIGETAYGLLIGYIIGKIRLQLGNNIKMQIIISLLTPFIAFLPPHQLGGSGVLATVVTSLFIGHNFLERLPASVRIVSTSFWIIIGFIISSILFLTLGLDFKNILSRIYNVQHSIIIFYAFIIITTVILGRFIYVFIGAYLPPLLLSTIRKKDSFPPWQYPFIVAWAGMRGVVSLAAALAIPFMVFPSIINQRDLIVFLVFSVIVATFIAQGLALPYIIRFLGLYKHRKSEVSNEQFNEINSRVIMAENVLIFLRKYRKRFPDNKTIQNEIEFQIRIYKRLKNKYLSFKNEFDKRKNKQEKNNPIDQLEEIKDLRTFSLKLIQIEKITLDKLFKEGKISYTTKKRLLQQLDYRSKTFLE